MTPIAKKDFPDNVKKFLMLITHTEGTDRDGKPYNCLFGHHYFDGYKTHPNKVIKIGSLASTAAGRYQVLYKTFLDFKKKHPEATFSPEWQDVIAVWLIQRRGAYQLVLDGKFKEAILKCNREWASLPDSPYGQPTHIMPEALAFVKKIDTTTGVAA